MIRQWGWALAGRFPDNSGFRPHPWHRACAPRVRDRAIPGVDPVNSANPLPHAAVATAEMPHRWFSRLSPSSLATGVAVAALAAGLIACSPRYDWRTIQSNEGAYAALYPGKPSGAAREVAIAGRKLPMTMDAARIDETLFAVGVVTLPADDAALRQAALESMQAGLLGNLGPHPAEAVKTRKVTVMSAASPAVPLDGVEVQVAAVSPQDQSPRRLTARLVASGVHVYQAVVLEAGDAARDQRQAEQVEQFLTGFHPF